MEKTRNLSKAEYFDAIQKEYLIAEFRRKFYYRTKDKEYYTRVMRFKRDKIEDIAQLNHLDSIFNSEDKRIEIASQLFDADGRPLFELNEYDERNYFNVGSEFSYKGEIWSLVKYDENGIVLEQKIKGKTVKVDKSEICRIL